MLISVIAIFVGTWNYNYLDNFVVTKLYKLNQSKLNQSKLNQSKLKQRKSNIDSLHIKFFDGVKDFLCDKLPRCC